MDHATVKRVTLFFLASQQEHRANSVTYCQVVASNLLIVSCFNLLMNFCLISLYMPFGERLTSSTNSGTSFSSLSGDDGTLPSMTSTGRLGDRPKLTQWGEQPLDSWRAVLYANNTLGMCRSQSF